MNKNLSKNGKITATFITLLFIATFMASLVPEATATPTITYITPDNGPVGTTVRVVGEINTTDGEYQILWNGESVKNETAVGRKVNDTFTVPPSTEGDHNVTLYDVANATESLPQTFTVRLGAFSCQVQTVNLANETLPNVVVEALNATTGQLVDFEVTNSTGWTLFTLDPGNYTFKALWKDIEVGIFPSQIINENKTLTLKCQLTNIEIAVKDEADVPLPLVNITIKPAGAQAESFETKTTESTKLHNMFTDINYTIEARRYGFLFNTTFIEKLSAQPWNNITVTCPTYTMSIHVVDSKGEVLPNVQVNLTEWSSWSFVDGGTADNQGNTNLSATFGRYKVRVYNYSTMLGTEVVLNETIVDLIEDWMPIVIRCKFFNVDLSVKTVDYFGQPIPNAVVEVEKKVGQDWVRINRLTTDLDGLVSLNNIVGGDLRISVQLAGKLLGIKQLHLHESKQILFKIDDYTVVGGYSVEVIQLITYVSIALLVVVFGLALTYKRLFQRFAEKTKAESKK